MAVRKGFANPVQGADSEMIDAPQQDAYQYITSGLNKPAFVWADEFTFNIGAMEIVTEAIDVRMHDVQVIRAPEPKGLPVIWNGALAFEVNGGAHAELTPPATPSPEPATPTISPKTSKAEATKSTVDVAIRPDNLMTTTPPAECKDLAITSPAGDIYLSILKRHLSLPASETPRGIHDLYTFLEFDIHSGYTRLTNHGISCEFSFDSTGRLQKLSDSYVFAQTGDIADSINAAIIDAYNRLDWTSFINSSDDLGPAPRAALRTKDNDEDWVAADRIRSVQAVTKVNPFNLPRKFARLVPNKPTNLRIVTVIVDEADVAISLETSDRFNSFINFQPAGQYWCPPAADAYGMASATWDVDATWDTTPAAPSPLPATAAVAETKISYRTPEGAALLRNIQLYLARPEGEVAADTSAWIDDNAAQMRDIRAGTASVVLSEVVREDIAVGWMGEGEAQENGRRELDEAIKKLDWDEIDSEPFF